jgi:GH24 family phage-related lysozyme (muramidase)
MSLRDDIIAEEGTIPYHYLDSRGYHSCGVGFNIDKDHGGVIPQPVIDFWLDYKLNAARADLDKYLPWANGRPAPVYEALWDMVYQMGIGSEDRKTGVLGFSTMLSCLHAGDWDGAKAAARASHWDAETPNRVERVIAKFHD